MWFTYLYADLIPIGSFVILIGLFLYYWVDKYNLLRRSYVKDHVSGDLAKKSLFLLDLTLLFKPLGSILFDAQVRKNTQYWNIIFLVFAIVYLILPWNKILDSINDESFNPNEKTYDEARKKFV
jgi:hypothetical protein